MATRRDILQSGLATAFVASPLMPALARTREGADAGEASSPAFYKVAYDGRYEAAAAFASTMAGRGVVTQDIRDDITSLWRDDLYHQWQKAPVAVAGMTTFASLLGLELMAAHPRLRVVYRAHHHLGEAATRHEVFGPRQLLRHADALAENESAWPVAAANIMLQIPSGPVSVSRSQSTVLDGMNYSVGHRSLISWVIAPVRNG